MKRTLVLTAIGVTAAASAVVAAAPAYADTAVAGTYNSVSTTRVLDTRSATGTPKAKLGARKALTFKPLAGLGVGSASSVLLSVSVVNPDAGGYLVVYPGGTTRPNVSSVNFEAHHSVPNSAVVKLGAGDTVSIYNGSNAPTDVIASVSGYWTGGTVSADTAGAFVPVTPARIVDSRANGSSALAANTSATITVAGKGGVPADASGVIVSVAATAKTTGYLAVAADQQSPPGATSSLNFLGGVGRANLIFTQLSSDGTIDLYNGSASPLTYFVDVFGYVTPGTPEADGSTVLASPYRAADDRGASALPAAKTTKIPLLDAGQNSVFKAVVLNVSTAAKSSGYMTVWNGVGTRPSGGANNLVANYPLAVSVVVPINDDGTVSIYNGTTTPLNALVDVDGFVLNDSSGLSPAAAHRAMSKALARSHSIAAHSLRS